MIKRATALLVLVALCGLLPATAQETQETADDAKKMADEAKAARGYIANLGHGCTPETPVEGVRAFTDAVRALAER